MLVDNDVKKQNVPFDARVVRAMCFWRTGQMLSRCLWASLIYLGWFFMLFLLRCQFSVISCLEILEGHDKNDSNK